MSKISTNAEKKSQEANNMISVKNLSVHYQGKYALKHISLNIAEGKITGVIGPNGAGKSTFLKGIMQLVKASEGEVFVGRSNLQTKRKYIAYVEQRSALDLSFPIRVEDVVLLGTYPKLGIFQRPKTIHKQKVKEALEEVRMSAFSKRQIGELSGGQLQRVFIARALVQEASIICLDEPFVGIDMTSEQIIIKLLQQLRDEGKTILIIHHDLHKVEEYFDELVILNKKLIASGPVEETFTTENIRKAYGESMGNIEIKGVR